MSWYDYNDLDLHCIQPDGIEISYLNYISKNGYLDKDANCMVNNHDFKNLNAKPNETISWFSDYSLKGIYNCSINYYAKQSIPDCINDNSYLKCFSSEITYFELEIRTLDSIYLFIGNITNGQSKYFDFKYN